MRDLMQAVIYTRTGSPDVLHVVDRDEPKPAPGEVCVAISRAGVNPTDVKTRAGSSSGQPVDPTQVPGQDGAGIVTAVGEGVDAGLVGQRVWIWEAAYQRPQGTAQQQAAVPVRQIVRLPDGISFDTGASLGIPFITAHRCLTIGEHAPQHLGPGALAGHTVLVAGGAGAVGNAAIQLARWSDALVIATVSGPQKGGLAALAGADHVINYRDQDVAAEIRKIAPAGVDSVVEVAISSNATLDTEVLRVGGSLASYANDGGSDVTLSIRALMSKNTRVQFVLVYTAPEESKRRAIDDISAALTAGAIRVGAEAGLPLHHYPLERAGDAHAAVEGGAVGKVLLDIA
jgi:NADPH2:quinone reductase